MTLTRTDKQFAATLAALLLSGAFAVWWEHGRGRLEAVARVLEFNRIDADHHDFDILVSPRGKGWSPMPVRWQIPERFRAKVSLEGEELWITVPLENAGQLESGELKLTYKRNQEGEVKIYRIGQSSSKNTRP